MLDQVENYVDDKGNPAGGIAKGTGFLIEWQNGPLVKPISDLQIGEVGHFNPASRSVRCEPNGAFVEDVLKAVLRRLEFCNSSKFRCRQNSLAITHIEEALHWLAARSRERLERGVEGTLEP